MIQNLLLLAPACESGLQYYIGSTIRWHKGAKPFAHLKTYFQEIGVQGNLLLKIKIVPNTSGPLMFLVDPLYNRTKYYLSV